MPPEQAEVTRWLVKAQHDWAVAQKALHPPGQQLDVAAFHCQQAVEKAFKAYLVAHAVEFERIHDLGRLTQRCARLDGAFDQLRDAVEPLTVYAVAFRDPGPDEPSRAHVEAALAVVAQVWTFVTERLPREVVPPGGPQGTA
jgi:HEPN domain-containing protein